MKLIELYMSGVIIYKILSVDDAVPVFEWAEQFQGPVREHGR